MPDTSMELTSRMALFLRHGSLMVLVEWSRRQYCSHINQRPEICRTSSVSLSDSEIAHDKSFQCLLRDIKSTRQSNSNSSFMAKHCLWTRIHLQLSLNGGRTKVVPKIVPHYHSNGFLDSTLTEMVLSITGYDQSNHNVSLYYYYYFYP